jgi:hypothetical protein
MYVKAVDEGGPLAEVGRDCKPCHYYVDSTYKAYLYNDNEVGYAKYDQRLKDGPLLEPPHGDFRHDGWIEECFVCFGLENSSLLFREQNIFHFHD